MSNKSKKVFIGAVMLEIQWELRQRDVIDLITPFVEYCVDISTSCGEIINQNKVIRKM